MPEKAPGAGPGQGPCPTRAHDGRWLTVRRHLSQAFPDPDTDDRSGDLGDLVELGMRGHSRKNRLPQPELPQNEANEVYLVWF